MWLTASAESSQEIPLKRTRTRSRKTSPALLEEPELAFSAKA